MKFVESQQSQNLGKDSIFLPHYPEDKKEEYSLIYGPSNMYLFISFFYSIYERILKAKDLVREKVALDIAEMAPSK